MSRRLALQLYGQAILGFFPLGTEVESSDDRMTFMLEQMVAVYHQKNPSYPEAAPFHPDRKYPEYGFGEFLSEQANMVYDAVREALRLSGLDRGRFGTSEWNPLGAHVKPGQFVLIKPNWVRVGHPRDPNGGEYTVTQGSVLRAICDYVWIALRGSGRVMVADGPQTDQSFSQIAKQTGMYDVQSFYRNQQMEMELVDFRQEEWENVDEVIVGRKRLPGDPSGNVLFDLGEHSEFEGHHGTGRYYGADYDTGEVNSHHHSGKHEYLVAGSSIFCDVFINVPKLKTHKKAGVTINLKNLVGVNADKNFLPHHTVGSPTTGGDQFPSLSLSTRIEHRSAALLRSIALRVPGLGTRLLRRARKVGKSAFGDNDRVIRSGNWYGNDTIWRMCLDLNKVVLYGQPDGTLRQNTPANRKPYLSFVDGFVAGDGTGPLDPDPVEAGLILFGTNPAVVDAVAATLMGFDPKKLPIIRNAFEMSHFPLATDDPSFITSISNQPELTGLIQEIMPTTVLPQFRPHFGWLGHIERRVSEPTFDDTADNTVLPIVEQ